MFSLKGCCSTGKRTKVLVLAFVMAGTLSATGCAPAMKDTYSLEEQIGMFADTAAGSAYIDGFASQLCVVPENAAFDPDFATSEAAALFDISDREVYYSKNPFERLYPASITKVMTALVAIKHADLKERVLVTEDAVITEAGATLCGIRPGDTLTMEQLLYGLMLPSGNDAGAAIAVHMADSIEGFADMMNEEAASLGATGTHFMNPHGLNDPDHYTTAYDLYLIFNEALKYPVFRQIIGASAFTANYHDKNSQPVSKTWKGGNWFMTGERETPEGLTVFGGKTGTTQAAGYCLIMGTRGPDDREYISVVLKADSRPHLYDNMGNIISEIVK
ncbi:MAG: serine hydrolase [Clostridium sp.]|nr:serine hydrolase [Clostridium sp.]